MLRPGNDRTVEGAAGTIVLARGKQSPAFGVMPPPKPEIYEYLEEKGFLYAIRLLANGVQEKIEL